MPNIYTKPNPGLCDLEHFFIVFDSFLREKKRPLLAPLLASRGWQSTLPLTSPVLKRGGSGAANTTRLGRRPAHAALRAHEPRGVRGEGLRPFGIQQACPVCRVELPLGPDTLTWRGGSQASILGRAG